ncbi:MAG TPA: Dam family site-specific DNA-(adenine-N6)-methyltransferase [Thermoanaerobaculia bacterium]
MSSSKEQQIKPLPIVKWPGGKRRLSRHILELFPKNFDCYFEPFMGGGAVFFSLCPERAVLSDADPDLINCYTQVRDSPERVISRLSQLRNTEEDYYKVRASRPRSDTGRAARLIYLVTLSFNGIYRLNSAGEFNVPYGHKTHLRPCDKHRIKLASAALSKASITCCDFELAVAKAKKGDVVYLDPPYTVAHSNNGFLKYNSKIFSWSDQMRLAGIARQLASKGCRVIVSNADHSSILNLYHDFHVARVQRPSNISANVKFRNAITELLFYI